ncbi:MAG: GntR family transcriptional regulator [Rhodothermales bacterium]
MPSRPAIRPRSPRSDEPRRLSEVAYERLRDAITRGDLPPGTPLAENTLSAEMNISRTPVREALQQLAQEGLVQVIPGRAVTVAAPSMEEVMNVVHMRALLEPEVSRLAALSASAQDIAAMQDAVVAMAEAADAGDRARWSQADTRYHETLCGACKNTLLGRLAMQMRNRIHYMINDPQTAPTRVRTCTDEHQLIIDAIARRDADAAEAATREHIGKLRKSLFERFAHL